MAIETHSMCPCCSGHPFCECCGPILEGKTIVSSAEQLMRSRYTAYVERDWDYLVETTHPKQQSKTLRADLEASDDHPQWSGLKILSVSGGHANDKIGKVQFEASYSIEGHPYSFVEHSRFKRFEGKWKYLDANG